MNVLYTTATCPSCKFLKIKLDKKGIEYRENQSLEDMEALGISSVPVLSVDGDLLSYIEANKWVENHSK